MNNNKITQPADKKHSRKTSSFGTDTILLQSLNDADQVVCVKDINKLVLEQNSSCKALCGDREGQVCLDGCMEIYDRDNDQQWEYWGNRTYQNSYVHDSYFDVTLLCSEQYLITILQPLAKRQATAIEYYKSIGLSKRELEVITQVVKGLSNLDICEKLSISNATLRTHLNKVYSKVNDAGAVVAHLPKNRHSARGVRE